MSIQPITHAQTHTTFNITLSLTPGISPDDELTFSILDGVTEVYLRGLQEYLNTLGIETETTISMQRCDYVDRE